MNDTMHRGTYSPEDNKLRLYPGYYLSAEELAEVKAAGYRWAGKQELFVCPRWTPKAEDLLLDYCGEIDDEDYSPAERAADRAERFGGYRDKRRAEAGGHADSYDAGPDAFGHQNRQRAERQAARHDRNRTRSLSQWSKAEYWQVRTAGVISSALYKAKPAVRRSRVLRLEAEQRKAAKTLTEAVEGRKHFVALAAGELPERYHSTVLDLCYRSDWLHPRTGETGSFYSLTLGEDPLTAVEAAQMYLDNTPEPGLPGTGNARWRAHYELRLDYERTMLDNEGGTAGEVDIVPGGFFGKYQVRGVNRSPATKLVTSVKIWSQHQWKRDKDGESLWCLNSVNIQRLGADAYRAPTDDEREQFAADEKERKTEAKANRKADPKPKLINPTDADAERLQSLWNAKAKERHDKHHRFISEYQPSEVRRMTQAEYSARSKGSYSHLETVDICTHGNRPRTRDGVPAESNPIAFKVRKSFAANSSMTSANRVVIVVDKPQKPLPLDWSAIEQPAEAEAVPVGQLF